MRVSVSVVTLKIAAKPPNISVGLAETYFLDYARPAFQALLDAYTGDLQQGFFMGLWGM